MKNKKILIAILFMATASSAQALETTIDFEDQSLISILDPVPSLTIENVTFIAGNSNGGSATLFIDDFGTDSGGDFSGNYLGNGAVGFTDLTLKFENSVSQFSFNLGNNQNDWELTGFDSSGMSIESLLINKIPQNASHNGAFFGLSSLSSEFSYATLTNIGLKGAFSVDEIEFDNLKYTEVSPVPEPSTYALMLGGLGMVGFMAYRRRKTANS